MGPHVLCEAVSRHCFVFTKLTLPFILSRHIPSSHCGLVVRSDGFRHRRGPGLEWESRRLLDEPLVDGSAFHIGFDGVCGLVDIPFAFTFFAFTAEVNGDVGCKVGLLSEIHPADFTVERHREFQTKEAMKTSKFKSKKVKT